MDYSLAGNYSCSAKNLFGEDEITYELIVILPPNPPILNIQYTTTNSIRVHWSQPKDGGSLIQGKSIIMNIRFTYIRLAFFSLAALGDSSSN